MTHPCTTLTIRIKNDERKMEHKHLLYEKYSLDEEDPIITPLVREAIKAFKDGFEEITLTAKKIWQS